MIGDWVGETPEQARLRLNSSAMYTRGGLLVVAGLRVAVLVARRWRNVWSVFVARAA